METDSPSVLAAKLRLREAIRTNVLFKRQLNLDRTKLLRLLQDKHFLCERHLLIRGKPKVGRPPAKAVDNNADGKECAVTKPKRKYKRRKKKDDDKEDSSASGAGGLPPAAPSSLPPPAAPMPLMDPRSSTPTSSSWSPLTQPPIPPPSSSSTRGLPSPPATSEAVPDNIFQDEDDEGHLIDDL